MKLEVELTTEVEEGFAKDLAEFLVITDDEPVSYTIYGDTIVFTRKTGMDGLDQDVVIDYLNDEEIDYHTVELIEES